MGLSSEKIVRFNGVVVGFEVLEKYGNVLYVQGSVDDKDSSFYLVVSPELYKEYEVRGVGRMIDGKGVLLSEDPIVIKYLGEK